MSPRGKRTPAEVKQALREVVSTVVEETLQEEAFEAKPGAIKDGRKLGWSRADIEALYPPVTFTPTENIPVTVFGKTWYLFADQEITVPSCVKGVYDDHQKMLRAAGRGVMTSYGPAVPIGQGGLQDEGR